MNKYVHGYSEIEANRLNNQADSLAALIHYDTIWEAGSLILEAGCGVGAQTKTVAPQNPNSQFISIDIPGINPLLVTEMRIFNVNGQVMYQGEVRNNMDVSDYPAGYYFLQVGNQHVKFIKR